MSSTYAMGPPEPWHVVVRGELIVIMLCVIPAVAVFRAVTGL